MAHQRPLPTSATTPRSVSTSQAEILQPSTDNSNFCEPAGTYPHISITNDGQASKKSDNDANIDVLQNEREGIDHGPRAPAPHSTQSSRSKEITIILDTLNTILFANQGTMSHDDYRDIRSVLDQFDITWPVVARGIGHPCSSYSQAEMFVHDNLFSTSQRPIPPLFAYYTYPGYIPFSPAYPIAYNDSSFDTFYGSGNVFPCVVSDVENDYSYDYHF